MIHPPRFALGLLPLGLLLALYLGGCAAPPAEIAVSPNDVQADDAQARALRQQHRARIANIAAWRVKGTMAVKTGRAGRGGRANLIWNHQRDRQEIELYGPFGGGRVRIAATDGRAVLRDTKGANIEAASVAEALRRRLGWPVPFDGLRHWARGLADADATELAWDRAGRLRSLRQGDWLVEFLEYNAVGALALPRRLTITAAPGRIEVYSRDGEYLGDEFSVKVVLRRWWDIRFES
ncbi:MAG: lipoprotein insertase outer membrane protein LolB [bacterium]